MPARTLRTDATHYEPCPIVERDFTESQVTNFKDTLDALIMYARFSSKSTYTAY